MKIYSLIFFLIISISSGYAQAGINLEYYAKTQIPTVGIFYGSEHYIYAVSKNLLGPIGEDYFFTKLSIGKKINHNTFPMISIGFSKTGSENILFHPSISFTFKGVNLGFDIRDGIHLGYYLVLGRRKSEN